jgi:hypothetical protein
MISSSSIPILGGVRGDGGYVPIVPMDVHESEQNAIIVFNGGVERLYLSVNINAERRTEGFHIIPFPSMPKISLGNFSIFTNITDYMNGIIWERNNESQSMGEGGTDRDPSVSVLLFEQLGRHRITVIKVEDPTDFRDDLEEVASFLGYDVNGWPMGLDRVIQDYVDRGILYFTLDNYPVSKDERTMDPLVFEFSSDEVFFPLEISSVFEGMGDINISMLTPEGIPMGNEYRSMVQRELVFHMTQEELARIDPSITDMIHGDACLVHIEMSLDFSGLEEDLVIPVESDIISSHVVVDEWVIDSACRIDDGTMLVYDESDREFEALALPGFDRIWNRSFDRMAPPYVEFRSLVIGAEPILLAYVNGLRDRSIKRIDPRCGRTIWAIDAPDMLFASTTMIQWPSQYGPLIAILGGDDPILMYPEDGSILPVEWPSTMTDRVVVTYGEDQLLAYSFDYAYHERDKCSLFSPFNISYFDPRDGRSHENVSGNIPLNGGFTLQRQIMDWELITGRPMRLDEVLELDLTADYPVGDEIEYYDRMWRTFRDDDFGTVVITDRSGHYIDRYDRSTGDIVWSIRPEGWFHGYHFHSAFIDVDHDDVDEMVLYDLYDNGIPNDHNPSRLMVIENSGEIILDKPFFTPIFPIQLLNDEYIIAGMGNESFSCFGLASHDVLYTYPVEGSDEDGIERFLVSYWDHDRANVTCISSRDPSSSKLMRSSSTDHDFDEIAHPSFRLCRYLDFGSTVVLWCDHEFLYSFKYDGSIPPREYPTIAVPEDHLGVNGLRLLLNSTAFEEEPEVDRPLIIPFPDPGPIFVLVVLIALVLNRSRHHIKKNGLLL